MRRHLTASLALATALVYAHDASAQSEGLADAVDAAVSKWMIDYGIKNAEVAVSARGAIIKKFAHGWGANDPHSIGSLSKAITGLCVAHLLDTGQLHLSDTIGGTLHAYFANKANPAPVDDRFEGITVEQLLTHRAGLVRNAFEATERTIESSFRSATKVMLQAAPGTAVSYSNTGYLILGYIAQTIGKKPYGTLCGAGVDALTGGVSGSIEPSLNYRAPNGGWNESAESYARLLRFLDPLFHDLGANSRVWLGSLPGDVGYAKSDNGTDQPPCDLFKGSPAYAFGACILRTARGTRYYHDGAVVGKPGGSMFFVNEAGYTAVVIFDAERNYGQLFKALSHVLTSPDAYPSTPP